VTGAAGVAGGGVFTHVASGSLGTTVTPAAGAAIFQETYEVATTPSRNPAATPIATCLNDRARVRKRFTA
jgi:hypothetical protein